MFQSSLRPYITLMRPYQWSKNLFILAPAFFGFNQYVFSEVWLNLILVLVAFCLISSAVYCINDIIDSELDKLHPSKKFRPLASGAVSKKQAFILVLVLLITGGGG